MRPFSKKWIDVLLGTAVACLGFSFLDGFSKREVLADVPTSSHATPENAVSTSASLGEIREALQTLLEGGQHYLGFSTNAEVSHSVLLNLYAKVGFQPLWFTGERKLSCASDVINKIKKADEEGLDASDYAPFLKKLEEYVGENATKQEAVSQEDLLRADLLLSYVLLQYISDIRGERLSPKKIDKELYLDKPKIDEPEVFLSLIQNASSNTCDWMEKLPPQNPEYSMLKEVLKDLKSKKARGEEEKNLSHGPSLKKGDKGKRVLELREVLTSRGYHSDGTDIFDESLEKAVKAYQKDLGLSVDGVVGSDVQEYLSKKLEDRINQVIVTLERWRWMPPVLGEKYLLVNIPQFEVRAYENNQCVFAMPIIVGRPYRETPVFDSEIINVIFNPTWNVPRMIAVQDKLKDVQKKGADYFIKKKIHVYKDGREIDPHQINWSHVTKENFNFHLKQDPGELNALGRIRFTIVSPFDVYLHGTPEQELFDKTKRTLSSGCIRLEDPIKMAEFVFGATSTWSEDAIKNAINSDKTVTIPLQVPVKVYIQYFTVSKDDQGTIRFLEDVYGQDKQILEALKARKAQAP
ncbi:MAG: L,D-transpeptidase family protein [Proteobacteria bacterium]|nr:L,D-transpeptidase family protein [Pseudomonadota bacterium]